VQTKHSREAIGSLLSYLMCALYFITQFAVIASELCVMARVYVHESMLIRV